MTRTPADAVPPASLAGEAGPLAQMIVGMGELVTETLFDAGLQLQHVLSTSDGEQSQHVRAVLDRIDQLIRIVRNTAFAAADPDPAAGARGRRSTRPAAGHDVAGSPDHVGGETGELLSQEQLLRERLHRVTVALALTEERIAEGFERLADSGGPRHEEYMLAAKRARASASECRESTLRLESAPSP